MCTSLALLRGHHLISILFALFICDGTLLQASLWRTFPMSLLLCSNVFSSIKHGPRFPATVTRAQIHAVVVLNWSTEMETASTTCPLLATPTPLLQSSHLKLTPLLTMDIWHNLSWLRLQPKCIWILNGRWPSDLCVDTEAFVFTCQAWVDVVKPDRNVVFM